MIGGKEALTDESVRGFVEFFLLLGSVDPGDPFQIVEAVVGLVRILIGIEEEHTRDRGEIGRKSSETFLGGVLISRALRLDRRGNERMISRMMKKERSSRTRHRKSRDLPRDTNRNTATMMKKKRWEDSKPEHSWHWRAS